MIDVNAHKIMLMEKSNGVVDMVDGNVIVKFSMILLTVCYGGESLVP